MKKRTILGLFALVFPLIGAPMGVKAEELKLSAPQSATSAVVNNTPIALEAKPASPQEQLAELRAMRARISGQADSEPGQPPVMSAIPDPADPQEKLVTTPRTDLIRPEGALPQQQAGELWKPIRLHTEVRSRPRDTTFDVKAEMVTKGGWMFGVQHVDSSGDFRGSNATDVFKGDYTDTRSEFWVGRHGATKDARTRWSVNALVRQLTHKDSGSGKSLPGTEYPYSYTWKNAPKPLTQVGVRARGERDVIRTESQQLTVHVEGEVAATVSAQLGVWYQTAQFKAYAEAGVNNTGAYANGYGRYYLTKGGQLRPFVEVRGEAGSGYHNVQVGGGLQVGISRNAYAEGVVDYNVGTSGNGLAATARLGFRF
jgi:hypothetical protein